jgi:hypothetical protein
MTLRETIQAEINEHQAEIAALRAQLQSTDPNVSALMGADMAALLALFALFKDRLS